MSRVVIIGGGPAGCMAAITAKKNGHDVVLIEKNNIIGKKLNITGKGRCNVTYKGDNQDFFNNVVSNSKFLISTINTFNNDDLIDYLDRLGIKTKLERGNRIFLKSDNALELSNRLYEELKKQNVKVIFNTTVKDILVNDNLIAGVITSNGEAIKCDSCIIATGGKSYPATGSTGDGYTLSQKLGHSISEILPALVPIKCYNQEECKNLQGLTLKNVKMKIVDIDNIKKSIYEAFGELLFTHFGISGPIVLSSSSKINKIKDINKKINERKIKCIIDLKPALSYEELYKRVNRDFEKYTNKEYKNSLDDLLPKSIIPIIIKRSRINEVKKVHQITKEERQNLVRVIKDFDLDLKSIYPVEAGIITAGGINTKEINPKTMESKIVSNLYFAGEVIDVDAYTGGYNLQIAFSTGYVAGSNIK